jgi:hypothetical protein
MLKLKKTMDPNVEPIRSIGLKAMNRPKSQNSNTGHDGALSNRNFVPNEAQLMLLNFEQPELGNGPKTKKCPRNFLFI